MSNPDRASNIPMVAVDETIAASVLVRLLDPD